MQAIRERTDLGWVVLWHEQLIEFESTALMVGHLGVRVSLILYPLVSVKKVRAALSVRTHACRFMLRIRTILKDNALWLFLCFILAGMHVCRSHRLVCIV